MDIGLDISRWQGRMDWDKAVSNGAKFVFIKASQGLYEDPMFRINWANSKGKLPRGAYCYMSWLVDPIKQADFFSNAVKGNELPLVADFESPKGNPGQKAATAYLKKFCERLIQLRGEIPMIYSNPSFWRAYGSKDIYWTKYPLWIANYGVAKPNIPAPWKLPAYWQYSDKGDGMAYGSQGRYIDLNLKFEVGPQPKGDCPGCREYFDLLGKQNA